MVSLPVFLTLIVFGEPGQQVKSIGFLKSGILVGIVSKADDFNLWAGTR
jgi:hypothetical protein